MMARKPFTDRISIQDFRDVKRRNAIIEAGIQRANSMASGVQELDSILWFLHHGDTDSDLVVDLLGYEIETEYTEEQLEEEILSSLDNSRLQNRIHSIGKFASVNALQDDVLRLFSKTTRKGILLRSPSKIIEIQSRLAKLYNGLI
jgi:hypothetical protein